MINGIQLKVCGITSVGDAEAAAGIGADFLGINLYPKSPRFLSSVAFSRMKANLPPLRRVAVMVRPSVEELRAAADVGFQSFQLHFDPGTDQALVESWGQAVGLDRLWLVPRLPPGQPFPPWAFPLAETFLVDTFRRDVYGGTGATGDWDHFRDLRNAHPEKCWVLAGGLGPANIAAALKESGSTMVDVNSGVESAPGVKDPARLKALVAAMGGVR